MRYLIACLLLILSVSAQAVQLDGLYSASVPVADQSPAVRKAAMAEALKKVIQKVSGRRQPVAEPSLQAALSNVSSYVEQFQYQRVEDELSAYRLRVSFQKSALDTVLQQFSVPVWGRNRPEVLLWLALDDGSTRYLLGAESTLDAVLPAASDAGLAMTLPLLDLDDQRALGFNDVWAGFAEQVLAASQRYGVKQVMHGRLLKIADNEWRLRARLLNAHEQYPEFEQQGRMDEVLAAFFATTAERLADIYAPRGLSQQRPLTMHISGVNDLAKLAEVSDYLSSLDRIKTVEWREIQGTELELLLTVSGDVSVLQEIIALNKVLSLAATPLMSAESPSQGLNEQGTVLQSPVLQGAATRLLPEVLYYRAD